jgi:hypothetical protein
MFTIQGLFFVGLICFGRYLQPGLSTHTALALATGLYPFQSLTQTFCHCEEERRSNLVANAIEYE